VASTTKSPARRRPAADRRPVAGGPGAAHAVGPLVRAVLGDPPVPVVFWDGTAAGPATGPGTIEVASPEALRHLLWAPGELGAGRAFVTGALEVHGDLFEVLRALRPCAPRLGRVVTTVPAALRVAGRLGLLGRRPGAPAEEATVGRRRHSRRRDAAAVTHHYDVGNDFYRLVLGPSMTYSCARFPTGAETLEAAQAAKHELVCRKLGLDRRPGLRLLDVGCGWGSMGLHAARHHGARVVGITLSGPQVALARRRVAEAGLGDAVEIRRQDYRELAGERFDAVSSVGMFEHVGRARAASYFAVLRSLLGEQGRLLNHAISSVGGSAPGRRTFTHRYIFPDGELADVAEVVAAMEAAGFEVRDVESLREHYVTTLRAWLANLADRWDEAVELVGSVRARAWRLYMTTSAVGFDDGGLAVHQVLGVVPAATGASGMPRTRAGWEAGPGPPAV